MREARYLISFRKTRRSELRLIELPQEKVGSWWQKVGQDCYSVLLVRVEEGDLTC